MILFIGNMLSKHGLTPAMTELLAKRMAENYEVKLVSQKRNKLSRLIDMLLIIYRNRISINLAVVDVYSSISFWYVVLCTFLLRLLNLPYITILRGGNLPDRLRANPRLCNEIFKNSAVNISPSGYLKKVFYERGFFVNVVPNFIDLVRYPFLKRPSFEPRLFWVRSFHKIYNPYLAIEIVMQLKRKYPDAKLCMVGPDKDGSLLECKKMVLENGLENTVEFTGKLSKDEWIHRSTQYDIFINTTNFDNMPVSVIESMALGLPVVSTNVGGLPYLIENGKTGILVNREDAASFVKAIQRLISDNDYAQQIAHAARKKAEAFDWEIVKEQWQNVISRYKTDA